MVLIAAGCCAFSLPVSFAQSGCCNETCNAGGIVLYATDPLAPAANGGYKAWASTTVNVGKDNNPPPWFSSSALSSMLTGARDAWDSKTCLGVGSGFNITLFFFSDSTAWSQFCGGAS